MSQPVGVLALRIWRSEQGETRARMSARLDVTDTTPVEMTYYVVPDDLDEAVRDLREWVSRYTATTRRSTSAD